MIRSITISSAPAVTPVSVTEAKTHLRVTQSGDDTYIGTLIEAATNEAERFMGRALINQTIELRLDGWPKDGIFRLPRAPVASVGSVKYYDTAGVEQTVTSTDYFTALSGDDPRVIFIPDFSWPDLQDGKPAAVKVTYAAGYGAAGSNVPALIRAGILFLIAHLYEQRTPIVVGAAVADLNYATERCWAPYRVFSLS
jgi:uncharacterized phiE125 gp8 family phage protein